MDWGNVFKVKKSVGIAAASFVAAAAGSIMMTASPASAQPAGCSQSAYVWYDGGYQWVRRLHARRLQRQHVATVHTGGEARLAARTGPEGELRHGVGERIIVL